MARSRNIKPGFFRNSDLVELSIEARMLFIGLWTLADRDGRMEDRPKQIKMEIFPADNVDCDKMLSELASIGVIDRYEVNGKRYLHVVNFSKHQNPHRDERASTIPDKNGNVASTVQAQCEESQQKPKASGKHSASTVQAQCEEDANTVGIRLIPDSGFLIPDSLSLMHPAASAAGRFEDFWKAWPKSERKQDKAKCLDKWKRSRLDQVADEILEDIRVKGQTEKWREGYIEAPLVYLNGRRWEDGVEAASGNQSSEAFV